jgi:hypothetical protein
VKNRIKILDVNIKSFFNNEKCKRVRESIVPGNLGSLWKAVRIANDVNHNQLPKSMFVDNNCELSDAFEAHFDMKIKSTLNSVSINDNVYNGTQLVNSVNKNFMSGDLIRDCLKSLKCKSSEGFDLIPQRILKDGAEILIKPLTQLFKKV